jgi:hypothetical protein
LQAIFLANVGGKGVRRLAGYFMGYYTIWLVLVKSFFVPFWELRKRGGDLCSDIATGNPKPTASKTRLWHPAACGRERVVYAE